MAKGRGRDGVEKPETSREKALSHASRLLGRRSGSGKTLEDARALIAPAFHERGKSLLPTELHVDDGREPEHIGLRAEVSKLKESLSIVIEVSSKSDDGNQKIKEFLIYSFLLALVSFLASVVIAIILLVIAISWLLHLY